MAFHISTGLAESIMGGSSIKDTMDLGFIDIYSGTVPANADASIGAATLLCRVSLNSTATGLTLLQDGRFLRKPPADVWSGTNAATGTATFYRQVLTGDTGALSSTDERIQGTVGLTNASEMTLTDTSFVSGSTFSLGGYVLEQPLSA